MKQLRRISQFGAFAGATLALAILPAAASAYTVQGTFGGHIIEGDGPIIIGCNQNGKIVDLGGKQNFGLNVDCDANSVLDVEAGPKDDVIDMSNVTAADFPNLTEMSIEGGGGSDTIVGNELVNVINKDVNDALVEDAGNDTVTAGRGTDFVHTGSGSDTIVWNNGDGTDQVLGGAGDDRQIVNGSPAAGDAFAIKPNGADVVFERTNLVPFSIALKGVEDLDLRPGAGADAVDATTLPAGLVRLAVDGGSENDAIVGSLGNDQLVGGSGDDGVDGRAGADVVFGNEGADAITANDGAVDVVDCGDGIDVAVADAFDSLLGCEPQGGPPIVQPPPPVVDAPQPAALSVRGAVLRQALGTVTRTGRLRARCTVNKTASCAMRATIAARTAKRLGLRVPRGAKRYVLASSTVLVVESRILNLRISRKERRALRGVRRLSVSVRTVAQTTAGERRVDSVQRALKR